MGSPSQLWIQFPNIDLAVGVVDLNPTFLDIAAVNEVPLLFLVHPFLHDHLVGIDGFHAGRGDNREF